MHSVFLIGHLDQDGELAWDQFVHLNEKAKIYHYLAWRKIIEEEFGHQTFYLQAKSKEGVLLGILPLVRIKSLLFGDYMVSMPFVNYGGAVAVSEDIEIELMKKGELLASNLGVRHIEFRDTEPRSGNWNLKTDKVIMELPLPSTEELLWQRLGSKLRSQVKRPLKEGAEVVKGGEALLGEFYTVFSRNMRDLGTPVYSQGFFSRILRAFPEAIKIIVVRLHGRPVASGFLIGHKGRLEIPWASSLREFNRFGPNMLLYWEALRTAINEGYRVFDFGRSSVGSGTYCFKKQWSAEPRHLYWHYWLKPGVPMPQLTPSNPKFRLAIAAWRQLPMFVTNRLGPLIVKNLP